MYLNRCVAAPSSENIGVLGATVTFLVEPILLKMECGRYEVSISPATLADIYGNY